MPISSTNINSPGSMLATSMSHRLLKNSSRSVALLDLFSAPVEASYRPADRRFARPHPKDGKQEFRLPSVGSPRPLFEVFCKESHRFLVELRSLAGGLPRLQGAALIELLAVALDRCSVDAETVGGLALGDALLHRPDDLLPEVHRVRFHVSVLPGAASSQPAVRTSHPGSRMNRPESLVAVAGCAIGSPRPSGAHAHGTEFQAPTPPRVSGTLQGSLASTMLWINRLNGLIARALGQVRSTSLPRNRVNNLGELRGWARGDASPGYSMAGRPVFETARVATTTDRRSFPDQVALGSPRGLLVPGLVSRPRRLSSAVLRALG